MRNPSKKIIKIKLKKGDEVIVIAGKNKGKTGKILSVIPALNKVIVSGINIAKKHMKPNNQQAGGITDKEIMEMALDETFFSQSREPWNSKTPFQTTIRQPRFVRGEGNKDGVYRTNRLGGDDLDVDPDLWDRQGWEEDA